MEVEALSASFSSGSSEGKTIFVADDGNFRLKFVGWTSFIKDIMRTSAVSTMTGGSLTVKASMAGVSTKWTAGRRTAVFVWVAKAPAFLALAGGWAIGSDWEMFTS